MQRFVLRLGASVLAVVPLMAACSSDDDGGSTGWGGGDVSADETMTIADFAFDPDTLSLPAGEDVTIQTER